MFFKYEVFILDGIMRIMGTRAFLASLFYLVVVYTNVIAQPEDDPVWTVIRAYQDASDELREQRNHSPDARRAWMQEWKTRFQEVVEQNPQSMYVEAARIDLLGLSNGLGEFGESQKVLQGMVSNAGSTLEKIRWYNELGEVSRAEYLANKDQNEARKSLDAFERAHALYLSLSSEERDSEVGGRQVISLYMAGGMSGMLGDHAKSATFYQSAREQFQMSTDIAARAVLVGYDLESITSQEMIEWVHAEQESNALNSLEILSKLRPYRWPPSHYALQYSILQYENNSKGFQDFVSDWLRQHAFDERTPILMARLGFSYFDDSLYEKALPIYEVLRDKHREDFQKLEPDAFKVGSGGHYDRVLSDLAIIYLRQGNFSGAEKVKNELKESLPQSKNIDMLTPENFSVDLVQFPQSQQWSTRNLFFRGAIMLLGIVVILVGLYLHFVKRM